MNWYFKVLKQYADFTGRARRMEYWMFQLFNTIITFGLLFASGFFSFIDVFEEGGEPNFDSFGGVFTFLTIYGLATFIPSLAVAARRLHDTGKSGWWICIYFVPCIGWLWLLILLCFESDHGPNQWGQNPKNIGNDRGINDIGRE